MNKKIDGRIVANKNRCKITDEQILEDIKAGYTRQEIADRHGVHVENLARRMKKLGVHARYAPNLGGTSQKKFGECWHYVPSFARSIQQKHPDFEYLETQKKCQTKRVRLRCKHCGTIIERASSTVSAKNLKCDYCEAKRKENKELSDKRIELIRLFYAYKEIKVIKICKCCGKEYYSQYATSVYCSPECKKKFRKMNGSIRRRCRHYGVYYDPSVKAEDIFERDKFVCQICGLVCDPKDKSWNGYFGAYSPTVDHIIALANGGNHVWGNVQCAHAICNSYKRDLYTVKREEVWT